MDRLHVRGVFSGHLFLQMWRVGVVELLCTLRLKEGELEGTDRAPNAELPNNSLTTHTPLIKGVHLHPLN